MPELRREVTIISRLGKMTTHISVKRHAFDAVEATFRVGQGKVFSDHLQLSGSDIRILAKGYLGLDQSLDYHGNLVLSGKRASERSILSAFLRDVHGRIILPFAVKGTVHDPKIVVDTRDVLARARDALSGKMGNETEGTP
jgi:AsmA-like C-terminal region